MKMRPIEADKSAIEDAIIEEAEEYEADLDCNQIETGCNTEEAGSITRKEKKNALHCLKVMIDEEVCEECDLYGTTGTDHCEADCVRVAIKALEQEPKTRQWIFVNERQPEENDYYLTTTMNHEVYCDYWEGDRFNRTEAVIAWMPLPEPAK